MTDLIKHKRLRRQHKAYLQKSRECNRRERMRLVAVASETSLIGKALREIGRAYVSTAWPLRTGTTVVATRDYEAGETVVEDDALAWSEELNRVQRVPHNGRLVWSMVHRVLANLSNLVDVGLHRTRHSDALRGVLAWFRNQGHDVRTYPALNRSVFNDDDGETVTWFACSYDCDPGDVLALYCYMHLAATPCQARLVSTPYPTTTVSGDDDEGGGGGGGGGILQMAVVTQLALYPTIARFEQACEPNTRMEGRSVIMETLETWLQWANFDQEDMADMAYAVSEAYGDDMTREEAEEEMYEVLGDVLCDAKAVLPTRHRGASSYMFSSNHGGEASIMYNVLRDLYNEVDVENKTRRRSSSSSDTLDGSTRKTPPAHDGDTGCDACRRTRARRTKCIDGLTDPALYQQLLESCSHKSRPASVRAVATRHIKAGEVFTVDHTQPVHTRQPGKLNVSMDAASRNVMGVASDSHASLQRIHKHAYTRVAYTHATGSSCRCDKCMPRCNYATCTDKAVYAYSCACHLVYYCSTKCRKGDAHRHRFECPDTDHNSIYHALIRRIENILVDGK